MTNRLEFTDVTIYAQFCAELQRQGIAYHGGDSSGGILWIIITGY